MSIKLLYFYFLFSIIIGCFSITSAQQQDTLLYNPKKGVGLSMNSDTASPYYYLPKVLELNLSWYYHWGDSYPTGLPDSIEWVPMILSYYGNQAKLNSQISYIDSLRDLGKVHHLLGYNEPDGPVVHMTVEQAIEAWPSLMSVNVPLGSPACTNATDQWMQDFMDSVAVHNYRVDFICVHWYGKPSVGSFLNYLQKVHNMYNKPIWITEFGVADFTHNVQDSSENHYSQDSVLTFMKEVIPTLDGYSWVQRYAWHASEHPKYWTSYLWVDSTSALSDPEGKYYAQHQYNKMDPTDYVGPIQINAQGNLEIFGLDNNGDIYSKWQSYAHYPNSQATAWSQWIQLPNMVTNDSEIAVGRNLDKTIQVFVSGGAGTNGDVFYTRQKAPNNSYFDSSWVDWKDIGGAGITSLRVTNNKDGSLNLFGIDSVGNVYHNSQSAPNSSSWTGWSQINGATLQAGFAVTPDTNGLIVLAGDERASAHHVLVTWQQSGDTWNNGWKDLGDAGGPNTSGNVRFARNLDGRLEMFVRGDNGDVWYRSQEENGPDTIWSNWQDLAGKSLRNDFAVTRSLDGRLVVIGIDQSSPHDIFDLWQATAGGGWSNTWHDEGLPSNVTLNSGIMVGLTVDGRMQFFAKGNDGNVWSKWWLYEDTTPSDYRWSRWTSSESNFGSPNIISGIGYGNKNKLNGNTSSGKFQLIGNYPNPFNPTTTIIYNLPRSTYVKLNVYDILGNRIRTLVSGYINAGTHSVKFNGSNLSSGVYLYRLQAGNFSQTKKLILIK